MQKTFADKVNRFNASLQLDLPLPEGTAVLNPFLNAESRGIAEQFYRKFYADTSPRTFLFGINPGRFGAGVTGVCFTDPIRLENICGIPNQLQKKPELSSEFVFKVIEAYGGPEAFYRDFFITAISPLGFTKDGLNLNYYDSKPLQNALKPFIIDTISKQLELGAGRKVAICLGEGANFKYFQKLNDEQQYFGRIIPLAHPRFVMQYKRRFLNDYISRYLEALLEAKSANFEAI
jgi:hypothetical protein